MQAPVPTETDRARPGDPVVLIHGMWMACPVMAVLAARLRRAGLRPVCFGYRTLAASPEHHAEALAARIRSLDAARVHIVAHSLGGLVAAALPAAGIPPGRTVALGSPLAGSTAARTLVGAGLGRILDAAAGALAAGAPSRLPRPTAAVAGTVPVGLGPLLARLPRPHDGLVAVADMAHPGLWRTTLVPATHFGLLLSRGAATATLRALTLAGAGPDPGVSFRHP